MSSTPIRPPGEGPFVHVALLYPDADHLRDAVADYALDAAAADEPLLAVLPFQSLRAVDDVLAASGAAVTELAAEDVGRNPSRLIPVIERFIDEQGGPARVISESIWPGREPAALAECLRHEALVNVALADAPLRLLCPFDVTRLSADVVAGARMTHPQLIEGDGLVASADYGDPIDVARGAHWPQAEPDGPVTDLAFDGDLAALRRRLAGDPITADLDPRRREDLVVAVNEATGNAVRHGDGTCDTRAWRDGDRVVVEVATPSAIPDPMAGRRRPDAAEPDGRGLWLINQLCDLSEVRSGPDGTSVRMHVAVA